VRVDNVDVLLIILQLIEQIKTKDFSTLEVIILSVSCMVVQGAGEMTTSQIYMRICGSQYTRFAAER
jgi:hypothetical protein